MENFASFELPPIDILQQQSKAIYLWKGVCDQLIDISQDTLVIIGTDDLVLPPANSMIQIPGAWLAQFKDGGHALMFQYPERLSPVVNAFLDN